MVLHVFPVAAVHVQDGQKLRSVGQRCGGNECPLQEQEQLMLVGMHGAGPNYSITLILFNSYCRYCWTLFELICYCEVFVCFLVFLFLRASCQDELHVLFLTVMSNVCVNL